jgi:hypothetical protein
VDDILTLITSLHLQEVPSLIQTNNNDKLPSPSSDQLSDERRLKRIAMFQRLAEMKEEINRPQINMKKIVELSMGGLTDDLRPFYWRLLLNYLPPDRSLWDKELATKRELYWTWQRELPVDPHDKPATELPETNVIEAVDHPLNTSLTSQWNQFFIDATTRQEIEKDVHRTFPHLNFFQQGQPEEDDNGKILINPHYRSLRSILFIWAKLNKGIAYVQGMNEILGPIYYVFATDPNENERQHAEPDAFFCFTNLMSEIRDNFCPLIDKYGIKLKMSILNDLLKEKDFELWENLETKQLNPQFYSFRWITLLLSQEFELPEVIRLWDTIFGDPKRFDHLLYICLSMLISLRTELMETDFAENVKMLLSYPNPNISELLEKANEIAQPDFQIVPPSSGDTIKEYITPGWFDNILTDI